MSTATHTLDETLLADLTDPQRQAVLHRDGPLLVLAGAGSGKTRVITRRAARLVLTADRRIDVLAVTFTNKAADEMTQRLAALGVGDRLNACTFHSFCARLLRIHAGAAGIEPNFTILDRDDRRKAVQQAVEACAASPANYPPAAIEMRISRAKNALKGVAEFAAEHDDWQHRQVVQFYEQYEKLLAHQNALDFDDLLLRTAVLLRDHESLRDEIEGRYPYVLIDEYQDTNAAQYAIARLLTLRRRNLCATGDPDQSIYGWRGADIGNILSFERDYPDAVVVRLEQNYRSTQRILSVAGALITANARRRDKALWTQNAAGEPVRVIEREDASAEADWIARDIVDRLADGAAPCEIAVFYRMNAQSRAIEEALLRHGLAYQIARGTEFYARKEIKDVLAYLRVMLNPRDEIALLRIINTPPRGIGETTVERLRAAAAAKGITVLDYLLAAPDLPALGRSGPKVREFAELLTSLNDLVEAAPAHGVEQVMRRTGLLALYAGEEAADASAGQNLQELLSAAAEFESHHAESSLRDWLEHTSLVGDIDAVKDERGKITLMTLHAAKGLEFPLVYISGLEDGILPMRRDGSSLFETDDEEERRLLFVGMTRAMTRLSLSCARHRMLQGRSERRNPSPFLRNLPHEEIEWLRDAEGSRGSSGYSTGAGGDPAGAGGDATGAGRGGLPADIEEWGIGTLVTDPRYGLGQVVSLYRSASQTNVVVQFKDGARRTMILEFAPLQRVDPYDVDTSFDTD